MRVLAAALKELIRLGVEGEALIAAIERLEAAAYSAHELDLRTVVDAATVHEDLAHLRSRRKKDRDRKRAKHSAENPQNSAETVSRPLSPEPPNPHPSVRDISTREGFERFWAAYPRKVAKPEALKAYAKAVAKIGGPDPPDVLVQAIERMSPEWTEPKFIPHPATWLNRDGWNDEPTPQAVSRPHDRTQPSPRNDRLSRAFSGAMDYLDELERRDRGSGGSGSSGPSGPGDGEGGYPRLAGPLSAVR